jgi:hypothetical protein
MAVWQWQWQWMTVAEWLGGSVAVGVAMAVALVTTVVFE